MYGLIIIPQSAFVKLKIPHSVRFVNIILKLGVFVVFYDQLLKLCKLNNLKPTPFIKSIGLSAGNLTRWKNGASVNSDILEAVSKHFRVSTDYLLGLTGAETPVQRKSDETELEILECFRRLDNRGKARVLIAAYDELDRLDKSLTTEAPKI